MRTVYLAGQGQSAVSSERATQGGRATEELHSTHTTKFFSLPTQAQTRESFFPSPLFSSL